MTALIPFPSAPRRALLALSLAALAGGALAAPDWQATAAERCRAQAPSAAHCDDPAWLADEAQRLQTVDVARRAAVRNNRQEQRALRELLQGSDFCKVQLQRYCAEGGSGCGPQLRSMCESVARQHAQCETQALQYCRQQRHGDCKATVARHCPAAEKKSVDQILARYDLDAGQEARLRQLATQLERNDRTAIGRLVTQLSQLLGLR